MLSWPTPTRGMMWSTSRTRNGNSVRHRQVDIGPREYVRASRHQPIVEQVAHGLLQAHVDQIDGLVCVL